MQRMAQLATELGVRIHLNEPVEQLLFQGKRAIGVATAQDEYRADAIVVNADFAQAMTSLVPNHLRRRWTDRRIARKQFSCSTFMLYLGIEGVYDDLPHHTIYLARDYIQNLAEIEKHHTLSADPSFYVQNACVTDASLAPDGMSTLYVLVPTSHQHPNLDWGDVQQYYRNLALRQLAKVGFTDVERRIRVEHVLTPDNWAHDYALYRGATFSLAHTLRQMLHLRPQNRFEDLDGVYLVGGGTHPGSGLPVLFESARITSRLLLEDRGYAPFWLSDTPLPAQTRAFTDTETFDHAAFSDAS